MEQDFKKVIFKGEQVANVVNCFQSKLNLIAEEYVDDFDIEKDIMLIFDNFTIRFEMNEELPAEIKAEINQSFKGCLEKYAVDVFSSSKPIES